MTDVLDRQIQQQVAIESEQLASAMQKDLQFLDTDGVHRLLISMASNTKKMESKVAQEALQANLLKSMRELLVEMDATISKVDFLLDHAAHGLVDAPDRKRFIASKAKCEAVSNSLLEAMDIIDPTPDDAFEQSMAAEHGNKIGKKRAELLQSGKKISLEETYKIFGVKK